MSTGPGPDPAAKPEQDSYLLGTHDAELQRLALQHRVWAADTAAHWDAAGFTAGKRILDVGCGPGFASADLAYRVGSGGEVLGLDRSQRFLDLMQGELERRGLGWARGRLAELDGEALAGLGLEPGWDGAYLRWVTCFLRDPAALLRTLADLLRRGATIAIQDYANYEALTLCPRSALLDRLTPAISESWRRTGASLDIGDELPRLLRESGFELRSIRPLVRAARPGEPHWEWATAFLTSYVPTLVESGLISADDCREFLAEWAARRADPNSYFFTPPQVAVVAVRA